MKVSTKQLLHNHPISGGKVSIRIASLDSKSKAKNCQVDMIVDGRMQPAMSMGSGLIPSSAVIEKMGVKNQKFSWSQPLKNTTGKSLKKVFISVIISDTLTEETENELLSLLNAHIPQLKIKSNKNSFKQEAKDKIKRTLIDYAAFEGLPQLNGLLNLNFGCNHAYVDSGLSSELPMVPDSQLDSDLQACPIQQSTSSELPFIE